MDALALEIRTIWGVSTLDVTYTSPPRSFTVAQGTSPLVAIGDDGAVTIHLPSEAIGTITVPEQGTFTLQDLVSADAARPFRISPAAVGRRLVLSVGAQVRMEAYGLVFEIALLRVSDVRLRDPAKWRPKTVERVMALSFALHVAAVAALAYHMPALGDDDTEATLHDQRLLNLTRIDSPAEDEPVVEDEDDDEGAFCHHHDVGVAGTKTTRDKTKRRYGVEGPQDNADPHLARIFAEASWAPFAHAAIVLVPIRGDRKAYTMPWGRDDVLGTDASSARGRMWGDTIGDVYGYAAIGARPPPPPEEEEEEEEDDDAPLVGLIPSTVGHGSGYVPTSFDAALFRRASSE